MKYFYILLNSYLLCLLLGLSQQGYVAAQIPQTTAADLVYLINLLRTNPTFFATQYLPQFSSDTNNHQILAIKNKLMQAAPCLPLTHSRGLEISTSQLLKLYPDTFRLANLPGQPVGELFHRHHPGAKRFGWQSGAGYDNPLEIICQLLLYRPALAQRFMSAPYTYIGIATTTDSAGCIVWLAAFAQMPTKIAEPPPPLPTDCPPGTKIKRKRRF